MPKPKPTETRKLTYAEAALLDLLPALDLPDGTRAPSGRASVGRRSSSAASA